MNNDLLEFIRSSLSQGTPRANIEANLLQSGWQKNQIDQTFKMVEGQDVSDPVLPWERVSYSDSNRRDEYLDIQAEPIKEVHSDNLINKPNKKRSFPPMVLFCDHFITDLFFFNFFI